MSSPQNIYTLCQSKYLNTAIAVVNLMEMDGKIVGC